MQPAVQIYTDGSCWPNPNGPGGWAYLIMWKEHRKEHYGGEPKSTNNRMELQAAIEGLRALKLDVIRRQDLPVELYSDSRYVVKGATEWRPSGYVEVS